MTSPDSSPATSPIGVLFVQSQTFFGADSGQHAILMRYLDRRSWRVHVACNRGEGGAQCPSLMAVNRIPDVTVRPTDFGRGFGDEASRTRETSRTRKTLVALTQLPRQILTTLELARYVRKNGIDIVHATWKPRDAVIGLVAATLGRATCVIHVHVKAATWMNWLVRWVMHHSDLIAISEFVGSSLVEFGYPPDRVHVVLNAIDLSRWDDQLGGVDEAGWTDHESADKVREEFAMPHNTTIVVCIARLNQWKGQLELIRAMARARDRGCDCLTLIVGEPHDDQRFDLPAAELLVRELGMRDRIVFTGYRQDIPRLLSASDLFAMPSFEEPFGVVYLEAMAMGKAVVSLDNGGTPEVVVHGETGLLSAPGDEDGLVDNIVTLVQDPASRLTMGEAGRRRVLESFTAERMAAEMAATYSRILDKQRTRGPKALSAWRRRLRQKAPAPGHVSGPKITDAVVTE